jgi:RNA polymerase sigma-70 factor (ECF subfamily)
MGNPVTMAGAFDATFGGFAERKDQRSGINGALSAARDAFYIFLAGPLAILFDTPVSLSSGGRLRLLGGLVALMTRPKAEVRSAAWASTETRQRFQQTIVPCLDAAYNFARYLSHDADAAQDIVQEAFLRAYRNFDGYRGGDPRAWIFAIVRNCYYVWQQDVRRKARFELPIVEDQGRQIEETPVPAQNVASDEDTPETSVIRRNEAERVRKVIGELPEAMREVLVLRELEDLSYRQIADIIDAPIGTVMSRLARARNEFGEAWQRLNGGATQP